MSSAPDDEQPSSTAGAPRGDSPPEPRSAAPTHVDPSSVLSRIRRAARLVHFRMRLARVLGVVPIAVPIPILVFIACVFDRWVWPHRLSVELALDLFALSVVGSLGALIVAAAWPLAPNAGTVALDHKHGLDSRLTNALEFAAVPPEKRTPLMQAAIDEACAFVASRPRKTTLRAGAAAPLFVALAATWWLLPLLLLPSAGMVATAAALKLNTPRKTLEKYFESKTRPLDIDNEDIDAISEEVKELQRPGQSPEMQAAIDKFNKLLEDLSAKRLDRNEAFRQMDALDKELTSNAKEERQKLSEELKKTAAELEKSELAKDAAEALKKEDLKKAEEELKKLAEKLKDPKQAKKIDKKELARLRDAMKKAAEQRKKALEAIDEERAKRKEELLKKKKQIEEEKDPKKKEEQEKLLKKKERELEQLDRESQKQQQANRELEQLDRELASAVADLMKELDLKPEDLQKAAEELEKAAQDLNRLDRESMTQNEKEKLKEKLERLRELIRKEGQSSKARKQLRKKFSAKANGNGKSRKGRKGKQGKQGDQGEQGDKGEKGDKGDQEGDDGDQGDEGEQGDDGENGKGDKPGQGEGEGEDGPDGEQGKGKNGKKGSGSSSEGEDLAREIELGLGKGQGGAPIPGGQGSEPGGGKEPGHGSGGPVAGKATNPKMGTQNVEAQGADTGQGPSNSQVIHSAAERGFRGSDYRKVFTKYRNAPEENMSREDIPDGYRFYVQHYFELIRPRD